MLLTSCQQPETKTVAPVDVFEQSAKRSASIVQSSYEQPNIVILLADDLGWADLGFRGSDIQTPNIDRLAREGLTLNRFYSCLLYTSPSPRDATLSRMPSSA